MIKRNTWITLGVFFLFLIFGLYITKYVKTPEPDKTPTPTSVILAIPGDIIKNPIEIVYLNPGKPGVSLKKDVDGNWLFMASDQMSVNQARVSEILSNLYSLQVQTILSSAMNAQDLGLIPPEQEIDLITSDKQPVKLLIGSQTPTQSGYYFQVNDSAPVIVSKGGLETLVNLLSEENLKVQATPTP